jgi:hypothetical protein
LRIGITPDSPEKRAKFDTQMAIAEMDRKRLGVVAAYVVEKSGGKKALRNYRYIAKGSGPIDTLTDNLGLSALVRQFPEMASQIKLIGSLISGGRGGRIKKPSLHPIEFRPCVAVLLPCPTRPIDQNRCRKSQNQGRGQEDLSGVSRETS